MYNIYTDGSCINNGKNESYGAWAYVVIKDEQIIFTESKGYNNTTNNRMELLAVINGIKKILEIEKDRNFECRIYTDSAYIHNCYLNKWYNLWENNNWKNSKKEPVKNKDLWKELIPFFNDLRFSFNKVKGHSGKNNNEKWNELVDNIAQSKAKEIKEYG